MKGKIFPEEVSDVVYKIRDKSEYIFEMIAERATDKEKPNSKEKIIIKLVSGETDMIKFWGGADGKVAFIGTFHAEKLADANQLFEIMLKSDLRLGKNQNA